MTNPIILKIKNALASFLQKKVTIDSGIVGLALKPLVVRVDGRQISNFAAAIGDDNHRYYITEKSGISCAHPLFPVRISWEIIKDLGHWLDYDLPVDLSTHLVHQGEYLEFLRLPEADDTLTLLGQVAALQPHKRGARLVLKFDYHDQEDQPVLTEFITAVLFNLQCKDGGRSIALPAGTDRVEEDSIVWEEAHDIARTMPYIYDGCTDISYPVHTDPRFARQMGLPDIILQGTATFAISVSVILRKELEDNPKVIRHLSAKFTDIVLLPNRLTVRLLKKTDKQYYFDVREKSGRYAIRGGYLEIN